MSVSQSHLSAIESGTTSLTAEQFLVVLKLFNVGANEFSGPAADPDAELQNALARFGAHNLHESSEIVPSAELDDLHRAISAGLTSASPRLITALAPVVVRHVDRINFRRLRADLVATGVDHRLDWLIENTRDALQTELSAAPPPTWAKRYRRALVILENALHLGTARGPKKAPLEPPDILDAGIRSKQTLREVASTSTVISRRWGIVSSLRPEHFAEALRGTREAG